MSSTSQVTTFSDMYADFQNRLREQTGVTASETIAKRWINIGLYDLHLGSWEKFPWAERQATIRTQPEYTTGTVSINKGSSSLTGSGTAWNTNNDFGVPNARTTGKIVINGSEEVYTISAVGSDTSITLNEPFIDDDVSGATYSYFEDEYALDADFLRPVDQQSFSENAEIRLISRTDFRRRFPRNKITGKPVVACLVERPFAGDTTPVRRVRFHRPPDQEYLIPYSFITNKLAVTSSGVAQANLVNDTDEPIVPLQYRHAIVYHALYNAYRDRKDDDRAQAAKGEYTDIILRLLGDQEIGRPLPQIRPRVSPYKHAAKRPYRGRGRRYTLGTRFDELRDW